jgi:hypothetical protein
MNRQTFTFPTHTGDQLDMTLIAAQTGLTFIAGVVCAVAVIFCLYALIRAVTR